MWLEIAFFVNLLARYSFVETKRYWNGVKHLLHYLHGITNMLEIYIIILSLLEKCAMKINQYWKRTKFNIIINTIQKKPHFESPIACSSSCWPGNKR